MNIYLIVFQLLTEERERSIIGFIKEYGIWARITSKTWCIKASDKTTADIRDNLNARMNLQNGERLIVIDISHSPWASYYLPKEVADWLKDDK